jgi:hypothetical protein
MESKLTGRRFVFEDRELTLHEAMIKRAKQLTDLRMEYAFVASQPLETTETIQVEVKPDDPRYEDAPIAEVWTTYDLSKSE